MEQLLKIAKFILDSFIHMWPYLLITIPLAVMVQLSGAAKLINKALSKNYLLSIVLATVLGAFSPFCSCGVIPIIASLLIGGVPLAPVMSFWIASPSMDPEIFLLSTAAIGWKLSVWRLVATFIISLCSGYITHIFIQKGWLGEKILRENMSLTRKNYIGKARATIIEWFNAVFALKRYRVKMNVQLISSNKLHANATQQCCIPVEDFSVVQDCSNDTCRSSSITFWRRLLNETWKATGMVVKFMSLAFFINALIQFYVPEDLITNLLGSGGSLSVIIASLIGIPVYTSNITALPLIGGLLELGMNEGAALAFLISGPITTLPAMAAVWGLVHRKVFLMYISFALIGAIFFGLLVFSIY